VSPVQCSQDRCCREASAEVRMAGSHHSYLCAMHLVLLKATLRGLSVVYEDSVFCGRRTLEIQTVVLVGARLARAVAP
jgi:hypothetical protein